MVDFMDRKSQSARTPSALDEPSRPSRHTGYGTVGQPVYGLDRPSATGHKGKVWAGPHQDFAALLTGRIRASQAGARGSGIRTPAPAQRPARAGPRPEGLPYRPGSEGLGVTAPGAEGELGGRPAEGVADFDGGSGLPAGLPAEVGAAEGEALGSGLGAVLGTVLTDGVGEEDGVRDGVGGPISGGAAGGAGRSGAGSGADTR
ncbi:hypothetical protein BGK67_28760 [Streptomyces subrutilus]|uniref:Uncharacterized protein n=1 Tax=Streptomyces subrutilus TaxID=36818 RepID=A0A1E5PZ24_9ACTN|nr:hypothetical protein BGK67_28760 [Streptomyces subrutilus]